MSKTVPARPSTAQFRPWPFPLSEAAREAAPPGRRTTTSSWSPPAGYTRLSQLLSPTIWNSSRRESPPPCLGALERTVIRCRTRPPEASGAMGSLWIAHSAKEPTMLYAEGRPPAGRAAGWPEAGASPPPPSPSEGAAMATSAARSFRFLSSHKASNVTIWPGASRTPSRRALRCTKTSSPPPAGVMKPKPRSSFHIFTVPSFRASELKHRTPASQCGRPPAWWRNVRGDDARGVAGPQRRLRLSARGPPPVTAAAGAEPAPHRGRRPSPHRPATRKMEACRRIVAAE
mmetsp:Transcript_3094/g.10314  ORF Transcript_3094/g.10314 Transcript_3094/m.10314 type:complete len:288 (+) Transcript_3094:106-969(+)